MKLVYDIYQAPLGIIRLIMDEFGIFRVVLTDDGWQECLLKLGELKRDEARCSNAIAQLDGYFHGKRQQFTIPLSLKGPQFSQKVWQELLTIPFGQTRSYADIALAVGNPRGYRAVGQANRLNPLPIFIPCHRVIGKNGTLTGYMGKKHLDMKEYLLGLEKSFKEARKCS